MFRTTPEADLDLLDIYEYGALKYGTPKAESYLTGLHEAFLALAESPYVFRERDELHPPVRMRRFRSHQIIYVIEDEDVLIVRVLGGRQDWQQHLD